MHSHFLCLCLNVNIMNEFLRRKPLVSFEESNTYIIRNVSGIMDKSFQQQTSKVHGIQQSLLINQTFYKNAVQIKKFQTNSNFNRL